MSKKTSTSLAKPFWKGQCHEIFWLKVLFIKQIFLCPDYNISVTSHFYDKFMKIPNLGPITGVHSWQCPFKILLLYLLHLVHPVTQVVLLHLHALHFLLDGLHFHLQRRACCKKVKVRVGANKEQFEMARLQYLSGTTSSYTTKYSYISSGKEKPSFLHLIPYQVPRIISSTFFCPWMDRNEHWWMDTDEWTLMNGHWWMDTDEWTLMNEHWWMDTDEWTLMNGHRLIDTLNWWMDTDNWTLMNLRGSTNIIFRGGAVI